MNICSSESYAAKDSDVKTLWPIVIDFSS